MGNKNNNNQVPASDNGSVVSSGVASRLRNLKDVGFRIKYMRDELGFSQKELANKVGVSVTTIQNWESGANRPTGGHLIELGKALRITSDWILSGDHELLAGYVVKVGGDSINVDEEKAGYDPHGGWKPRSIEEFTGVEKGLGLGQAVEKLAQIYQSKNKNLIRAINANLDAFSETIDRIRREKEALAEVEALKARQSTIEEQFSILSDQHKEVVANNEVLESLFVEEMQKLGKSNGGRRQEDRRKKVIENYPNDRRSGQDRRRQPSIEK